MLKLTVDDRRAVVESLAAELTNAAYPVLLKGGLGGSWVELELGLWKGLTQTLSQWLRELPPDRVAESVASWKNGLLMDLVDSALFVAQQQETQEPLSYLKSGLREAFGSAFNRSRPLPPRRPAFGAYP